MNCPGRSLIQPRVSRVDPATGSGGSSPHARIVHPLRFTYGLTLQHCVSPASRSPSPTIASTPPKLHPRADRRVSTCSHIQHPSLMWSCIHSSIAHADVIQCSGWRLSKALPLSPTHARRGMGATFETPRPRQGDSCSSSVRKRFGHGRRLAGIDHASSFLSHARSQAITAQATADLRTDLR